MKRKYAVSLSVFLAVCWIAVVWMKTGIYFETNDDRFIAETLAGAMLAEPDAHVFYMNYFLSLPISLLYRLTTQVPWYGMILVLFHVMAYLIVFESAYSRCTSRKTVMLATAVLGCSMLLNLYITALLQYTSTAALLAVAGYVGLILQKDRKKGLLFFFLLELLAFCVRSQAMLMIQPVGCATYGALCLSENGYRFRKEWRKIAECCAIVCCVLLIGQIGSFIGYHGVKWQEYKRFNEAETILFDYSGKPPYEEVKSILDKYHVTETEYLAFCDYVTIDWEIPLECMEELAEYASKQKQATLDILEVFGQIKDSWDYNHNMGINQACILLWIAMVIWVLFQHSRGLLLPLSGLAITHSMVLGYLLWRGRTPARIMYPMASAEVLLLLALFIRDWEHYRYPYKGSRLMIAILLVTGILWGKSCVDAGREQYHHAKQYNTGQQVFIEGAVEIQEYCNHFPENHYLIDAWSYSYYCGSAFETRIYQKANCVLTGSWYSNSPVTCEYLNQYLEDGNRELYLITYDQKTSNRDYIIQFFQEYTGREAEVVDCLTVSHGGTYLVYRF